ncbi:MAG: ChpI protein [Chloroflexi bacterium]|nr:ChpI protein [Chloroflexota bacterium]
MKTAISLPDPIFEAAEDLVKRLGISRSQLYATALVKYLDSFNDEAVIQALNEVYADSAETIDPVLMHMQIHTLPEEAW